MTEQDYLVQLRVELREFSPAEVATIVADHEEHFRAAKAAGKSDDEIAARLGSARSVANEYRANQVERKVAEAHSLSERASAFGHGAVVMFALAPFNFFMLVGPFLCAAVLLFSGLVTAAAILFAALCATGFSLFVGGPTLLLKLSALFLCLAGVGASFALLLACIKGTEWFWRMSVAYLRWNLALARRRPENKETLGGNHAS